MSNVKIAFAVCALFIIACESEETDKQVSQLNKKILELNNTISSLEAHNSTLSQKVDSLSSLLQDNKNTPKKKRPSISTPSAPISKRYTKAAFEKKFTYLSKRKVRSILGTPCHVNNNEWSYEIDIIDNESGMTYSKADFRFFEDGFTLFYYSNYPCSD